MNNTLINWIVAITLLTGELCLVQGCGDVSAAKPVVAKQERPVDEILAKMNETAGHLKSYQCKVEYLFSQPVLESKTLRTGTLCYARFGNGSKLRINFDTLKQDEEQEQKYIEHYIFDGRWLTHIDCQIKQAQKRQLAEPNESIDAFELARRNFPIIGFSKTDDLEQQFEVSCVDEPNGLIHLHLKVKPDSIYKDDYKSVEVWIDKGAMLPAKIMAVSTEGDIYEIKFVVPKANEKIDEKVFEFTIPDGFGVEITSFKESKKKSDRESTRSLDLN